MAAGCEFSFIQPVSQGLVFAASEAEWKAYQTLSCQDIIGMA